MPWKETSTMDQKMTFIHEWLAGKYSVTQLCKSYKISRTTAYKIINKFEKNGYHGLENITTAPNNHPNKTHPIIEENILKLKEQFPRWGAKKIRQLLFNQGLDQNIPSVVTVHNILKKNGLVKQQKRRHKVKAVYPIFDPKECNEVWSADFKGKFRMGNNKYCHTLTIADSRSRYIFAAKAMSREKYQPVKQEFTRVFRHYGIPGQIHTDNGTPFGSVRAIRRFTRLSYWFIDLGIMPVFSDPGHPEQNGRHERMHRDLKAECAKPSSYDFKSQQRRLNTFLKQYNNIRPHEALDMKTPSQIHKIENKPFPERIPKYEYQTNLKVVNVTANGAVRWKSIFWVYISQALAKKQVAMEELGNGIWKVYYKNVMLGYFNEKYFIDKDNRTNLKHILV